MAKLSGCDRGCEAHKDYSAHCLTLNGTRLLTLDAELRWEDVLARKPPRCCTESLLRVRMTHTFVKMLTDLWDHLSSLRPGAIT